MTRVVLIRPFGLWFEKDELKPPCIWLLQIWWVELLGLIRCSAVCKFEHIEVEIDWIGEGSKFFSQRMTEKQVLRQRGEDFVTSFWSSTVQFSIFICHRFLLLLFVMFLCEGQWCPFLMHLLSSIYTSTSILLIFGILDSLPPFNLPPLFLSRS